MTAAKNMQQELRDGITRQQAFMMGVKPEDINPDSLVAQCIDEMVEAINSLVRECAELPIDLPKDAVLTSAQFRKLREKEHASNQYAQQFLNRWLCLEDGLTVKQRMEKLENNLMERKSE